MFPWHYDYTRHIKANGLYEPLEFFFDVRLRYQIDLEGIKRMQDIAYPSLKDKDQHLKDQVEKIGDMLSNKNFSDFEKELMRYEKFKLLSMRGIEVELLNKALILLMVSNYDHFLYVVIIELYKLYPEWRNNHAKKLSEKPSFRNKSLDEKEKAIAKKAINSFTRSSRVDQIRLIDKKLGTKIEIHYSKWEEFIEITGRRNLFVHTGGAISPQYIDLCEKYNIDFYDGDDRKYMLSIDDDYIDTAIDCFYELAFIITQEVSRQVYKEDLSIADVKLKVEVLELLEKERWDTAERILEYAVSISEGLTSGEFEDLFRLNLSFIRKIAGKEYKNLLAFIDWSRAEKVFEQFEQQAFYLLIHKNWELAERFYEYIFYTIDDLTLQIDTKIFVINNCIAKKFTNKPFIDILHSIDWSKERKDYQLAVAILEDKFEVALDLMKNDYVRENIGEDEYKIWPIFTEFRKIDSFKKAFYEIFGKEYIDRESDNET